MLKRAKPGEIAQIHAHLAAGNQVLIKPEYGCGQVLSKKHVEYIRADGNGYRLGWPGKRSEYAFAHIVFYVAEGYGY